MYFTPKCSIERFRNLKVSQKTCSGPALTLVLTFSIHLLSFLLTRTLIRIYVHSSALNLLFVTSFFQLRKSVKYDHSTVSIFCYYDLSVSQSSHSISVMDMKLFLTWSDASTILISLMCLFITSKYHGKTQRRHACHRHNEALRSSPLFVYKTV